MHFFSTLNLPDLLGQTLGEMNLEIPSPIQAEIIPVALSHRDIIGCAQASTEKTVAFCLPVIARLIKVPQKTALVLVPSQALGTQIVEVLNKLTVYYPEIKSALVVSGTSPQLRTPQGRARIIVATPEGLVEQLKRGALSLSSTEILILDEADRMLDMGLTPQLNEILRFLPKTRQTLFFSATLPTSLVKLSSRFLKEPVRLTANIGLPKNAGELLPRISRSSKTGSNVRVRAVLISEKTPLRHTLAHS